MLNGVFPLGLETTQNTKYRELGRKDEIRMKLTLPEDVEELPEEITMPVSVNEGDREAVQ